MMHENRQDFTRELRGLFSETQVCKHASKARFSKGHSIVCDVVIRRHLARADGDGNRKMSFDSVVADQSQGVSVLGNAERAGSFWIISH